MFTVATTNAVRLSNTYQECSATPVHLVNAFGEIIIGKNGTSSIERPGLMARGYFAMSLGWFILFRAALLESKKSDRFSLIDYGARMRFIFFLSVAPLLASCATGTLTDPKAIQAIQNVNIYEDLTPEQYDILMKIEGLSCGKAWWNESSQAEAIKFLKVEATKKSEKFDGITNVTCENTGFSWKYNCNNSFLCKGDVFNFRKKETKK